MSFCIEGYLFSKISHIYKSLFTGLLIAACFNVQAYTFTITSLNNSGTGTLREALSYVNNGDSIVFAVTGTINITSELSCTKSIHLLGPGADSLVIDAGNNSRVFNLNTVGSLFIEGLTIKDGHLISSSQLEGGGIYATVDSLYLTGVVLTSNNIGTSASSGSTNVKGGGAYIESEFLEFNNVEVTGNTSKGRPIAYGGGLYLVSDVVRLFNTNIYNNGVYTDQYVGSSTATGGGAYIDGDSIYLEQCNIYSNLARGESGWQTYNGATTKGGGLYTTNSSSSNNKLIMQNVAIYSNNSNSVGNYSYPYAGGWYGEDHDIIADSLKMYSNRIIMYDWYDGSGRGYAAYLNGISSFNITNSSIYNHAQNQGGYDQYVAYINASGTVGFDHFKAYNNDIQANYSQGIFYLAGSSGTIENAEFYNNNVYSSSIMRTIVSNFTGTLTIEQSSFYENDRNFSVEGGDLTLINTTMTDNTDEIYTTDTSITITLINSTVDGTITAPDMEFENTILYNPSLSGTISTGGGNIINSPSYTSSFTLSTDKNNVNPAFDTLDYHGGYTKVYSIMPFSQAINSGVSNGITVDQRGYTRNGNVDIGAFEYNGTNPNVCGTISETDVVHACAAYTWIDGNTYTVNNTTAQDTFTTGGGCDSVVTLNLTIHEPDSTTHSVQTCGSYTWIDSNTYTSNNSAATHTLQNQYGCDSVITLNLTMTSGAQFIDTITACGSYTWINGQTYTSSTNTVVYTIQDTANAGCDTNITLNLTILNDVHQTQFITACSSYTWIDGNTYTSSNSTATHSFTSANGCDSVLHLNLTILNSTTGTDVQTACGSYTWINGNTYTSSNSTATYTLSGSNGCDSVVTLNLTILNSSSSTDNIAACESYTWLDGNTYTSSNSTATYTTQNAQGCDSVISLNLTINPNVNQTQFITACESYTWIDGNTYTSPNNTASDTFASSNGCDSIINLNLTILNPSTGTDVVSACNSYTWIDGNTYSSSNSSATHTLVGANGCDSVVTLNLTIQNSTSSIDTVVACQSYTWLDGNTYTSSNSTATYTTQNAQGCDSVITLYLTINSAINQTQFITACGSYTWIDGNTYTSSNTTATHVMTRSNGCDSILHLNLSMLSPSSSSSVITRCDSYTWIDGNTYTESNDSATVTLTNSVGCDSVITLDLTILNSTSSTDTIEACETYTWIDGKTYNASNNTATLEIFNSSGCDSIIHLDLTIYKAKSTLFDTLIWEGDTVTVGSSLYTEEGVYTDVFNTVHGCDSVVTTIIYSEVNGLKKVGETNMRIYPNPTMRSITIEGSWSGAEGQIRVLNLAGQPIQVFNFKSRNVKQVVDLANQPSGIYFVELLDQGSRSVHRVVKVP